MAGRRILSFQQIVAGVGRAWHVHCCTEDAGLRWPFLCACGNGNTNPAEPAAHTLGNYHGIREIVPFVNRTFEWGVVIATFLSVLSMGVPRHCARLTYFLHPKLRNANYPTANYPYPAAPAARRKHSQCLRP